MPFQTRRRRLTVAHFANISSNRTAFIAVLLLLSLISPTYLQAQTAPERASSNSKTPEQMPLLESGKPIERELKGGEVHSYKIALSAGQYLKTIVEQRGIDVVVRLFAPDGKQIIEVDSPNGTQGAEPVSVVTEAAGNYRLEIRSLEANATAGRYEAKIEELRSATAQDKGRIAAERAFGEAVQLAAQGTTDSNRKAIEKFEQSLAYWRTSGEQAKEGEVLSQIGFIYNNLGDKQKALESYAQSLQAYKVGGNRLEQATTLGSIGLIYNDLREHQKALEFHNRSLELFKAINNRFGEATVLRSIANVYGSLEDRRKELEFNNQSLQIFRALGEKEQEAYTLMFIGAVYNVLDEQQKAIEVLNNALQMFRALAGKSEEALTLLALGASYDKLGDWQKAIELYHQALSIFRKIDDNSGVSLTLNNIGSVYGSLGDERKSLDYSIQALELKRKIGERRGEGVDLNNIGMSYRRLGDKQKALDYFNEALPLIRAEGNRRGETVLLRNFGNIHRELGSLQKALEYLNQSLENARDIKTRRDEAYTLGDLGLVYHTLDEKEKPSKFLKQSLELTRAVGDRSREAYTLAAIARVERDRDNLTEALTQIESAINLVESLRSKIGSQDSRSSYFASVQDYYELYTDILMRLHKKSPSQNFDALALQANERARARSLLELLTESRADIRQGIDLSLLERERTLQRQLNSKAEQQTQLLEGKDTEEKAAKIKKEIDALTTELQQVETEIRQKSPRYAALTQPQPLNLKEIQTQVLDSDTLLLEYSLGEDKSYLWAVTTDSITSYELPKRAEIEIAARRFYELLTARNERSVSVKGETETQKTARLAKDRERVAKADAELPEAANKLSQMILSPAAAQLGTKRLLIVADGALQYIPFAALPSPKSKVQSTKSKVQTSKSGQTETPQPLIVENEIVSLPSASTLAVLRRETAGRKSAAETVAVVADPVFSRDDARVDEAIARLKTKDAGKAAENAAAKSSTSTSLVRALEETGITRGGSSLARLDGTRREANSILALAPNGAGMKAIDFQASRATVTSGELARYRIVHFATHGLLNSEHPELSGIVLSLVDERGEAQDGFLRLHEIYNLKLPADLVVLSACQTALGKEIKGEGLVGLTRGFMYAGAPRVVASLWQVDDTATEELMRRFYQAMLTDKLRPAAALRRAQIEMTKQKGLYRKPYNWAAFVLQGEWK